jgi:phosphate:Na+ symporter
MAITIMMAYKGWITFPLAAAIVLGENIGTTITANLAALGMNTGAKRAALAHTVFNCIGVLWVLILYYPFLHLVEMISPGTMADPKDMPVMLSVFHSIFNVLNTTLLIGFVQPISRCVTRILPLHKAELPQAYEIPLVPAHIPEALESNLITAQAEIGRFAEIVQDILLQVLKMSGLSTAEEARQLKSEIAESEAYTDEIQETITHFLTECTVDSMSERQATMLNNYQRITNELESIADSCLNMAALFAKRTERHYKLHKKGTAQLHNYITQVLEFLRYNRDFLTHTITEYQYETALQMEQSINNERDHLRRLSRKKIAKGADIRAELFFIDVVRHLEHIGDYSLNISQAIRQIEA